MFAVLHIADFSLHAVLRAEPASLGAPAALFDGAKKKSLVLALNPAARAAGVELGMSAPQAVARCAKLLIRTPQPDAEAEARAAVFAVAFTLSPSIEDTAPGVCTIDLKGADPAHHVGAAAKAVAHLAQLGLPATAGIARTPLLALYAAHAAAARFPSCGSPASSSAARSPAAPAVLSSSTPPSRSAASAADCSRASASPSCADSSAASAVLAIIDEKNFLAPLPLATASPSPELARVLLHWGLRTLGDLTALPRDDIVRRFGAEGLALWNRASGGAPRPLNPVTPPRTFAAAMEFEEHLETLEPLLFILRRFLARLALELDAAHHVAAELSLTLTLADDTRHARDFRLPEPTSDEEILFRALHTHLESLRTDASVAAVQLRLIPTRPLVRQQGLFETGLRDPHGFAETLARIAALVGSDRVGTPLLDDAHRPDAFKLAPPPAVVPSPAPPPIHAPLGLPLRRFRPPLPVKLELTDRQPTYVWTDRFHGAIAEVRGPWRSDGDWWQKDRTWSRAEWDIALADGGGLYRLIHVGTAYFIEGEYD